MIDVILAATGLRQEPDLVASASREGMRIVRRCVDAVDLLAAAAVGADVVVVVSAGLPRLSADVSARLGVTRRVIGLAEDPLDSTALDGMGIGAVVAVGAVAEETCRSVHSALDSGSAGDGPGPDDTGVWTTACGREAT